MKQLLYKTEKQTSFSLDTILNIIKLFLYKTKQIDCRLSRTINSTTEI
ncbi:hypothetical protein [Aliarcobacter butzleri]